MTWMPALMHAEVGVDAVVVFDDLHTIHHAQMSRQVVHAGTRAGRSLAHDHEHGVEELEVLVVVMEPDAEVIQKLGSVHRAGAPGGNPEPTQLRDEAPP